MRHCTLILLMIILTLRVVSGWAQETRPAHLCRGVVLDRSTKKPIQGVILTAHPLSKERQSTKTLAFSSTGEDGAFEFGVSGDHPSIHLKVRLMGYQEQLLSISFPLTAPLTIHLSESADALPEVTVFDNSPITSVGDTITYKASSFMTPSTYSAEDLIKRLPGITVDTRGLIKYMGESIQGVHIEGLDLIEKNYPVGTRIIKAKDILAVEVMERFQKIKALRGVEEGKGAMLNIRLKNNNMLTPSGDATVGTGALGEQKALYDLGANTLLINSKIQILSAIGLGTTTQQRPQDLSYTDNIPSASVREMLGQSSSMTSSPSEALAYKEAGGTMNHLVKLKGEARIKYNLNYNYQSQRRENGQSADLYNGTDYTHFDEHLANSARSHTAITAFNYNDNASHRYIENNLDVQGDFLDRIKDVRRNHSPIHEEVRVGELRLADQFIFIRREESDVLRLNASINYRRLPKAVYQVPEGAFAYHQTLQGQDLSASTRFDYGWGLGGYYDIHGNLMLEGHYNDALLSGEGKVIDAEAKGGKLLATTSPTLAYNGIRLKWTLAFPLEMTWDNYRYLDIKKEAQDYRRLRVRPGAKFNISYRPGPLWRFGWSASFSHRQESALEDFMLGSFRTSFDAVSTKKELMIPQHRKLSTHLDISYRRALKGLFAQLTLSGSRGITDRFANTILHGTTKESILDSRKKVTHNAYGQFFFSKHFTKLMTLVSVTTDYSYMALPIMIGGVESLNRHQALSVSTEINSTPLKWFELSASIRHTGSVFENEFATNRTHEWDLNGGMSLHFGSSFTAKLQSDNALLRQDGADYPARSLFSATLTYRRPRYQIALSCDNLFNETTYHRYSSKEADRYRSYTLLRPRQILLNLIMKY